MTNSTDFGFDRQKILNVVTSVPTEDRNAYPGHIFEPERIEIMRELVLKEFYKLFRFMNKKDFEKLGNTIPQWLIGHGYELAPVADYWNFLDGIMISLKLKDIGPSLTSKNITWQLEQLKPRDLKLSSPVGTVAQDSKYPYTHASIEQSILKQPDRLKENLKISDQKATDTLLPRDNFPIIVRRNIDKTLTLLDGNRRTLRAWLKNKPTILAWVGTVTAEPALKNHWVSTSSLRRLLALYENNPTPEIEQSVRAQLKILFESSIIAKHHYKTRCLPHYQFAGKLAQGLL